MTTARAVRIENYGGPEVMQFVDSELPEPGQGEACIRHTAIGLNFIDIYHRTGLYPLELPSGLGTEAAGVVEAIGPGVSDINVGDRVVYSGRPLGAYADRRNVDAGQLVNIPDAVSDDEAAAGFLKGMTAWFLLHRSYAVQAGDPILVYAAAGGVGSILSQWGRYLDARVIGIVSSERPVIE